MNLSRYDEFPRELVESALSNLEPVEQFVEIVGRMELEVDRG